MCGRPWRQQPLDGELQCIESSQLDSQLPCIESHNADRALDRVGIDLDAAVVEEPGEAGDGI